MKNTFKERLQKTGTELTKEKIEILQINIGKLCNLGCYHCHVDAGPNRNKEVMSLKTAKSISKLMDFFDLSIVDLTGGAPELNPNFPFLVKEAKKRNLHVIDRSNLVVLFESGQEYLADFLAENHIEIIASLPCYLKENVDKQRGLGVFEKSIEALLLLNGLGYAQEGTGLILNLLYNPLGANLPPNQKELERDYKECLFKSFGIVFNNLFTVTNMPITRFERYLKKKNQYNEYTEMLKNKFNPNVVSNLMCKKTISISWDGKLFDCDFNQMLEMQNMFDEPLTIHNVSANKLKNLQIQTGQHCFGCTAGAGSSCQGDLERN